MSYPRMVFIASLSVLLAACGDETSTSHTLSATLATVQRGLTATFGSIDAGLRTATASLAITGIDTAAARPAVGAACAQRSYAVDCATIDTAGILRIVEPAEYQQYEGADVSAQPAVQKLLQTGQPVFSDAFTGVEGIQSVTFASPVFSSGPVLEGSLSLLASPAVLCDAVIAPAVAGTPLTSWVMQLDGLIVYETDPTQIGLNLFTDPLYQPYPELIALGERIAAEPSGEGYYTFLIHGTDTVVRKKAVWDTVSLFDNQWRVVIYRVVS
jgi:hypothetical protein